MQETCKMGQELIYLGDTELSKLNDNLEKLNKNLERLLETQKHPGPKEVKDG